MAIRPTGNSSYTPPKANDPQSRFGATLESIEESGEILGGGLAEIDAKASSANTGMSELAARVAALEDAHVPDLSGLPLLLHWDGTGKRPTLKPGWALLNTATGEITS